MDTKDLSKAAALQAKVDDLSHASANLQAGAEQLIDLEYDNRVDDWEFSSSHAIAREYMDSQQDVVNVL